MTIVLSDATQSWTLVSALIAGLTAQAVVIGILWRAYTSVQDKYEKRLQQNAADLVPIIVEHAAQAKSMHTSAERLLEAALRLEQRRAGGTGSIGGADAGGAT